MGAAKARQDAPLSTPLPPLDAEERTRWTRIGTLAALAMVLGYLETFIPIPIPGAKLGLANIAVLIALARRDTAGAFFIAVVKVLAAGFLFGNPVTMAYSAVGTALAFAVMALLALIPGLHVVFVSIAGALVHEAGQLVVAMALLGTPLVWYSTPALALAGCATGALCGMLAARALRAQPNEQVDLQPLSGDSNANWLQREKPAFNLDARLVFALFAVFAIVVLHVQSLPAAGIAAAVALACCLIARVRAREFARALRPLLLIIAITFIAQVASIQEGAVLFQAGPITVTEGAVMAACLMALRLIAVVAASLAAMRLTTLAGLIGALDWALSPLRRAGVRTAGFLYALEVAIGSVPALLSLFGETPRRWRILAKALPAYIASIVNSDEQRG